jgi:hypothetical protein
MTRATARLSEHDLRRELHDIANDIQSFAMKTCSSFGLFVPL